MRRIVVSEFVTVDGVMEDPGGSEGSSQGGWAFKFNRGPEGDKFKLDEVFEAGALLLGRRTYEGFAQAWPSRTDEVGFADKMNAMPKFVVSASLKTASWTNTTVVNGYSRDAIVELKEQPGRDVLVAGSAQLVQALTRDDLVDEYRLMVFPLVLGGGKRLFGRTDGLKRLRLVESRTVGPDGVLIITYEPERETAAAGVAAASRQAGGQTR